ncbi:MAG: hypothetical protein QE285_16780 [Aquabacterium sp.]|nr:hypothetical protein [Aquabacterium sp.]
MVRSLALIPATLVTDMAYLMRSTRLGGIQRLPDERRMLGDWFDSRFAQPAAR